MVQQRENADMSSDSCRGRGRREGAPSSKPGRFKGPGSMSGGTLTENVEKLGSLKKDAQTKTRLGGKRVH